MYAKNSQNSLSVYLNDTTHNGLLSQWTWGIECSLIALQCIQDKRIAI